MLIFVAANENLKPNYWVSKLKFNGTIFESGREVDRLTAATTTNSFTHCSITNPKHSQISSSASIFVSTMARSSALDTPLMNIHRIKAH